MIVYSLTSYYSCNKKQLVEITAAFVLILIFVLWKRNHIYTVGWLIRYLG